MLCGNLKGSAATIFNEQIERTPFHGKLEVTVSDELPSLSGKGGIVAINSVTGDVVMATASIRGNDLGVYPGRGDAHRRSEPIPTLRSSEPKPVSMRAGSAGAP